MRLDPSTQKVKIGHYYNEKYYHTIIKEDMDCFVGDRLLFSFRKNVLDNDKWLSLAKKHLEKRVLTSDKRKIAGATSSRKLVNSGIIGYYDGLTPQMKADLGVNKAGRATAYTANYPQDWLAMVPLFQELNQWYKKVSPFYYKIQKKEARHIEPSLLIKNTVFSTVTVNRDWRTATHTDRGNFSDAMSCIAVLGEKFNGGYLGFPRYRIAVDVGPGDVILMDGHEPHGNTEMTIEKDGCRFSMVCYLREDMRLFHKPVYKNNHLYYLSS
jgi:hypothetical protein